VIDVPAEEPKVKAMIDSMLAEFPNNVLLFSALYGDQTPGEVTFTDKVWCVGGDALRWLVLTLGRCVCCLHAGGARKDSV
jgi:hypothetical protein